jgi:hypothetical protein
VTAQEGVFFVGLPMAFLVLIAWHWLGRSWWYVFVPVSMGRNYVPPHC